ncbi:MAG: cation-translocating P-type ATPase [Lachnospiraceae bacterium]|nr:cation-translocating P-type ATPase [Lachnospiraceae bacterium]
MRRFMKKLEYVLDIGGMKRDIIFLIISGFALLCSIFHWTPLPFDIAWIAIILCGIPIILEAIIGMVTEFDIKADVLVSLALIASICIGENFAAGEVAFIMQLGALLEDLTVAKARAGLEKLVHLTPQTARRIADGLETVIPAEKVQIGDLLRVLPGETIPVDGVIVSGATSINQAVMTGESLPVDKSAGDEVASGTVNQYGTFEMEAVKVGEDSSIQRMIRLVQSADAGKAKIVGIADRWATWIVVIALTAAALTWLITGEIIRAVTILVVFCPCALVLATPTAIMAAIGNAAKHGFLVREGDALERLATVKHIAFDKTGTLTYGNPEVIAVKASGADLSEAQLYQYAAAVEKLSEHPLGKAVVKCYSRTSNEPLPEISNFKMLPGKGISACICEKQIFAGNTALLLEQGITIDRSMIQSADEYLQKGSTVIYVAVNRIPVGFIALADTIRPESTGMIDTLNRIGIQPILLTGDHENAARTIAAKLHIKDVKANCLPEDKLNTIAKYQKAKEPVCMIGDGINDAPALKQSDVGIAMGGIGSDIAVDAADIALVDDKVEEIPHLLSLAKRMMTTIKLNLTFSLSLNFAAIILAITGILNPVVGALVHNAGSVLVIVNSALLLKWRKNKAI